MQCPVCRVAFGEARGVTMRRGEAIRVLAADDHPLMREGIRAALGTEPDIELVAEAATGAEAIERYRSCLPDVTLMDLQMPGMTGIDTISAIRNEFPDARIVVLTMYAGDVQAVRAIKAGAAGYLLKGMVRKELLDTIRRVHSGARQIPAEIAAEIAGHAGEEPLTPREVSVLRLVALGNANKQIAAELGIVEETVKAHMSSIMGKLEANDRTHAVTIALRRGVFAI